MKRKSDLRIVWKYCFNNEMKTELREKCQYASNRSIIDNMNTYNNQDLSDEELNQRIANAIEELYTNEQWNELVNKAEMQRKAEAIEIKKSSDDTKSVKSSESISEYEIKKILNYFADILAEKIVQKLENINN